MAYNFEMRLNNAIKKLHYLGSDPSIEARAAKRRAQAKEDMKETDKNLGLAIENLGKGKKKSAVAVQKSDRPTLDPEYWDTAEMSPRVTGEANWSSPSDKSVGTVGYAAEQAKRNHANNQMAYMTPLGGHQTPGGEAKVQEQGQLNHQDEKTIAGIQQGAGMMGSSVHTGPDPSPYMMPPPGSPMFGGMPDPRGRY